MKNILVILTFLAAGCSKSSNEQKPGGALGEHTVSEQGSGSYSAQSSITQSEMPDQNCDLEIDSRLKVGNEFDAVVKMETDGVGFAGFATTQVITGVTADTISSKYKILEIVGLTGVSAGSEFDSTCTKSGNQSSCTATMESPDMSAHLKYNNCTVTQQADFKFAGSRGIYKFSGGESVAALQILMTIRGQVQCNGVDLGLGQIESSAIYTGEAPSSGFSRCGNTILFMFNRVTIGNKILNSFNTEVQSIR